MAGSTTTDPSPADARTPALLDDDDPALFPKLSDDQLDLLAKRGHVRATEVGEVLFRDGDATYDAMVLLEGQVAVLMGSAAPERVLTIHRARDLMIELSILTGQRVHATGVVREAGSVLVVPAQKFRALLAREPVFGDFVLQMLFRQRQAVERLRMGIRIIGSRFDRDTHRLREFAARNRVLHSWVDIDEPRRERLLAMLPTDARESPIVLLGNGAWLHNPTNAELADKIGVPHGSIPAEKTYDLVVVGAGPAGLAATVYGASGGLLTATLDAMAVGGQAATSARIENYLGFPAGLSGAELAERARLQAEKFKAHLMVPCRAVGLAGRDGFHVVTLDTGGKLLARSVILALGVQYRRLPIPRVADYEGLGISYAADFVRYDGWHADTRFSQQHPRGRDLRWPALRVSRLQHVRERLHGGKWTADDRGPDRDVAARNADRDRTEPVCIRPPRPRPGRGGRRHRVCCRRPLPPAGGIQKWTFDGTTWSLANTLNAGLSTGARGLTAFVTGANVTLVATTGEATQNKLVVAVDDGSAAPAVTTIATAAANTMFHGVALAPQ